MKWKVRGEKSDRKQSQGSWSKADGRKASERTCDACAGRCSAWLGFSSDCVGGSTAAWASTSSRATFKCPSRSIRCKVKPLWSTSTGMERKPRWGHLSSVCSITNRLIFLSTPKNFWWIDFHWFEFESASFANIQTQTQAHEYILHLSIIALATVINCKVDAVN